MNRLLVRAYALNTLAASAYSVRREIKARPFGVSTPLTITHDVLLGYGAGIAAPWPMVLALWFALERDSARRVVCSLLLIGAMSEPAALDAVKAKPSRMATLLTACNLAIPLSLMRKTDPTKSSIQ